MVHLRFFLPAQDKQSAFIHAVDEIRSAHLCAPAGTAVQSITKLRQWAQPAFCFALIDK